MCENPPGTKKERLTHKPSSNEILRPKTKIHTYDLKKTCLTAPNECQLKVQRYVIQNQTALFEYWYVSFCCSHILYFLHVLLCCLIDEGKLLEYQVNQQGFIFREQTIDNEALSKRQLTISHFWRDNESTRGHFQIDN